MMNQKKGSWNKRTLFLLLVCILALIQIAGSIRIQNKRKAHFVTLVSNSAYGVSINLEAALTGPEDTFTGIGGARIYLEQLARDFRITDYAFRYNVLWRERDFLEGLGNAYMAVTFVQDKFEAIYQKHVNGEGLAESDLTYLKELQATLDELYSSLRNEDGTLKKEATKSAYFVERFNQFIKTMYM